LSENIIEEILLLQIESCLSIIFKYTVLRFSLHNLQARKFYEAAIRLEPGFLGAALALADLHVSEGRNREAVMLLERYLRQWADDSLHIKLAQVFAATNMLSDALSHYQSALRCVFLGG
jgi:Tfp pilus assembly protein PilF